MQGKYLAGLLLLSLSFSGTQAQNELSAIIYKALAAGKTDIRLPKKEYTLQLDSNAPLLLKGLKNIHIDLNGSSVICQRTTQAIQVTACENLVMENFSIDYDPLPFTEGKIVALDQERRMWMVVDIFEGYRLDGIEQALPDRLQIFDRHTMALRKNLYTYWPHNFSRVEKLGPSRFKFYKSAYNQNANEALNDYVVFTVATPEPTRPHAIVITGSKNIRLQNITLYASNCFGFFEDQCDGNQYYQCRVTKNQQDKKKAFPRLRSVNADAFHSKAAKKGPLVEYCEFRFAGDDCIAINSSFYLVTKTFGAAVEVLETDGVVKMQPGDRLRFVDETGRLAGDARLMSVTHADNYDSGIITQLMDKYELKPGHIHGIAKLQLDTALTLEPGVVVSSLDRAGSGFLIRNNTLGFTRARGILVKASDGMIEGNQVEGCELSGIVLSPELSWMEAGFSQRVVIRNNIVKDCMFANSSYGIEQAAPISVIAINAKKQIAPEGGFQHITIHHNQIINCPLPAIIATSLTYGTISDNTILIRSVPGRPHGKNFGVDNSKLIWTKNTNHLLITGNK